MPLTGFESRGGSGGCRACRSLEHRTCGKEEVNGEQSAVVPGRPSWELDRGGLKRNA